MKANLHEEGNTRVKARKDERADDKLADECWVEEFSTFFLSTTSPYTTP